MGGGERLGIPAGEGMHQLQMGFGLCPSAGPFPWKPTWCRAGVRVQAEQIRPGKTGLAAGPRRGEKFPACGWWCGGFSQAFPLRGL